MGYPFSRLTLITPLCPQTLNKTDTSMLHLTQDEISYSKNNNWKFGSRILAGTERHEEKQILSVLSPLQHGLSHVYPSVCIFLRFLLQCASFQKLEVTLTLCLINSLKTTHKSEPYSKRLRWQKAPGEKRKKKSKGDVNVRRDL